VNKLRLLLAFRKEIDMKIKSPPDPKPLVLKKLLVLDLRIGLKNYLTLNKSLILFTVKGEK